MARLNNKSLFFVTSPRTPSKMIPEIKLLCENLSGKKWNKETQVSFIDMLSKSDFFEGIGSGKNKDFSARDRINRAPKALGFVDLSPKLKLTPAGKEFVYGKRPQEIFLRQLLKFQFPSPYHIENKNIKDTFCIKPYLEIMRLIRNLDGISFDELKIFALSLTDYHNFDTVEQDIKTFRKDKENHIGHYKEFADKLWTDKISKIYQEEISAGRTQTRETTDDSLKTFIKTKKSNSRDYADACFRYLRYTGLVSVSNKKRSISFYEDKLKEVDYILTHIDRQPVFIDNEEDYKSYLFDSTIPLLYVDNIDNIVDTVMRISDFTKKQLDNKTVEELKDLRDEIVAVRQKAVIDEQVTAIKSYGLYSEIIDTYNEIIADEYYDAPLMLEYNTWRAMTMLDGGNIKGNFKFDDKGQPLSTASGNMPDIECDYSDFALSVEVTMQYGQRQYESEGEPVARHYGQLKKRVGKETYCLFIAPSINNAALAHFYGLNHVPIALYGGKSKIIPLDLDQFMKMVENSYSYQSRPNPTHIRQFLDKAIDLCEKASDENQWRDDLQSCVNAWLANC